MLCAPLRHDPPMSDAFLQRLRGLLPGDALLTDAGSLRRYAHDDSRRQGEPLAVALPRTRGQVAAVVHACSEHGVAGTARGAGPRPTGAIVLVRGSLVLSPAPLGRILRTDPGQRLAVVDPGVINLDLQRAAGPLGLFWPAVPASADRCPVAGNLACNAGGPRTV